MTMLPCQQFYDVLVERGITFFTGVPDSFLKNFLACIEDNAEYGKHIVTANEGSAVALAAGYHLATGKIAAVYMQNSGQGNATNPLTSLADKVVYGIPILLLVGWRGEPGEKDEPQHIKDGQITLRLLEVLGIPYEVLPHDEKAAEKSIEKAIAMMKSISSPYALVVRNSTFEQYIPARSETKPQYELSREIALKYVVDALDDRDVVVSTTGKLSRELFEYREALRHGHERDFLTVGSMGHASQIALGIALQKPERMVYCLDGDGALIMHMGHAATIGTMQPKNFKHIIFNNGAHDSVGGQQTAAFNIDIPSIAKACGYLTAWRAKTANEIKEKMGLIKSLDGPALMEIRVAKGARKDLGRPRSTPIENKKAFMEFLSE